MLTGRITYGIGALGQGDETGAGSPLTVSSSVVTTAPAQWGLGEWTVVLGGLAVFYSMFSTGKRGVRRAQDWRYQRKKALAEKHQAAADYYKA